MTANALKVCLTMYIMFIMVIANTFSFVWLFQGLGKIRMISIFNMISKLLILPITFILVKCPDDYLKAAFIQAFVYLLSSLIAIFFVVKDKMVSFVLMTSEIRGRK